MREFRVGDKVRISTNGDRGFECHLDEYELEAMRDKTILTVECAYYPSEIELEEFDEPFNYKWLKLYHRPT